MWQMVQAHPSAARSPASGGVHVGHAALRGGSRPRLELPRRPERGLPDLPTRRPGYEDYPVLLAYTLIGAVLTVAGNLLADVALTVADPRIRLA